MTRKDHILIASRIRISREAPLGEHICQDSWNRACEDIAHVMARALATNDPHFDRECFLKACGVQS